VVGNLDSGRNSLSSVVEQRAAAIVMPLSVWGKGHWEGGSLMYTLKYIPTPLLGYMELEFKLKVCSF
jgi:hypothetical protein